MIPTLHTKLPKDPLKRIVGTQASHKVLYFPLSRDMKVVGIGSTRFLSRNNPSITVFTGSEIACEYYIKYHKIY